jgi:hypothetical protein
MPARADDMSSAPRLTGSRLCEISGINRQTRDKWAAEGLLRKADDYDQLDLVETVALGLLLATLRKKHARVAWLAIRPELKSVMPGPQLTMVWDAERRSADLAFDAKTIAKLVRHGRPVQVIDLGTAIERAREAYRRDREAAAGVDPPLARLRAPAKGRTRKRSHSPAQATRPR